MRAFTLSLNLVLVGVLVAVFVHNGESFGKFQDTAERNFIQSLLRKHAKQGARRLTTYKYNNCGDPKKELANVSQLVFGPDPISLPGELDVQFDIDLKQTIHSPLLGTIDLRIKSGSSWVKVPCIGEIGSCTYDDVCTWLALIPACPDPFINNNIPCQCPFPQGHYQLGETSFEVDIAIFPSGDYHAIANLTFANQNVACVELYFTFA